MRILLYTVCSSLSWCEDNLCTSTWTPTTTNNNNMSMCVLVQQPSPPITQAAAATSLNILAGVADTTPMVPSLDVAMVDLHNATFAKFVVRRGRFCPPPARLNATIPRPAPTATPGQQRPYKCTVPGCTSLFGKANHLSRHIRIVHNKERPFACDRPDCNSRFGSRSHLVDHVNAVHKRLRNFRCDRCDAAFSKSFNLAKHKRLMHTKVAKNHRCQHCDLSFGTRSHLTRHVTKVHPLRLLSDVSSSSNSDTASMELDE